MVLEAIDKYKDNWDEIIKVFNGKRNKSDCIVHLMQLPIKENVSFKVTDLNMQNESTNKEEINAVTNQSDPLIGQVLFFAKMFEKYVEDDKKKEENNNNEMNDNTSDLSSTDKMKEVIYKTYAKSIDVSKKLQNEQKNEMKKIMNLLVHLEMKKIELKLAYFNDFEKLIQFQNQQIKTMESQVFQDRIKLALKKNEIIGLSQKVKEQEKTGPTQELIEKINEVKIANDTKVIDLLNNVQPKGDTNNVNITNGLQSL